MTDMFKGARGRVILYAGIVLCLLAGLLVLYKDKAGAAQDGRKAPVFSAPLAQEELTVHTKNGTDVVFHVELALTQSQQRTGLMHRTTLPADGGMLFIFARTGPRSFWMKNTHIPLDMLFIDEQGIITHIHRNATPESEAPIPSQGPVRAVLEINGGAAEKHGIGVGDRIRSATLSASAAQVHDAMK